MDDIKATTQKLTNNGFLQHVFNFDSDTKKYLMNTSQYVLLSLGPVVLLNKLLEDVLSDFDDTKGNIELLAEVVAQLLGLTTGIFFIHRLITYIPTYSNVKYADFNIINIILGFLVIVLSLQTKLGEKVNILLERIIEVVEGKVNIKGSYIKLIDNELQFTIKNSIGWQRNRIGIIKINLSKEFLR